MSKPEKNSIKKEAPTDFDEIVEIVKKAWEDRANPHARLEMVQELLAKEFKRGEIVRIVTKAFNCKRITVDRDIAAAKKSFVDFLRENNQEKHLGSAVARMRAIVRDAHKRGELTAAVQASKHHDHLLGLIDAEIAIGGKIDLSLETMRANVALKLSSIAKSSKKGRVPKKPNK